MHVIMSVCLSPDQAQGLEQRVQELKKLHEKKHADIVAEAERLMSVARVSAALKDVDRANKALALRTSSEKQAKKINPANLVRAMIHKGTKDMPATMSTLELLLEVGSARGRPRGS